jgi:hypothetical protein
MMDEYWHCTCSDAIGRSILPGAWSETGDAKVILGWALPTFLC